MDFKDIIEDKTTIVIGIIVILAIYWFFTRKPNQAPGPWLKVPALGSIPFLMPITPVHECLMRLKKQYGDIFRVTLGTEIVVITTYELVKEGYQKQGDALSGRPFPPQLRIGNRGILISDGEVWRDQRRFALSTLRDFGMGKVSAENSIILEAENLVNELMKHASVPFNVQVTLGITTSNVICDVVFGKRYEYDDPLCEVFIKAFTENAGAARSLLSRLPTKYRKLLPFLKDTTEELIEKNKKDVEKIIDELVDEHKKTFDVNSIRDFIDAYLAEMEKRKENGNESVNFNEYQMFRTIFDLFIAGTETTSTTLRWGILYMCMNPDIQKRVQEEIDENIEKGNFPTMSDKQNIPFTEAVLLEIQRLAVLVPLVPHRATEDMTLGGYNIYKDTVVVAHIWALSKDPKVWKYPNTFDPRNFLDDNGKVINRENLASFSIGRRQCAGESLAKMELFVFFVSMMHRFTFSLPSDETITLDDYVTGAVRMPLPYKVILTPR